MKKVGILENRFDLIGLELANEVPIEPLTRFSCNLLSLGSGFLVAVFTKIPRSKCKQVINQLVRMVFGYHNKRDLL
jgi:hypothetical protein